MSDVELDRIRRDLQTMKDAAGTELPFGREELRNNVLHGLLAVPLAIWATVGPGTHMSLAIIVTLITMALADWFWGAKYRRQRFQHPSRWKEFRIQTLAPLAAAPLVLFGCYWAIANGTPVGTMIGLVLFAGGAACCLIALFSQRRRHYCGMGAVMMTCGIVMPWCSEQQTGLAFALLFLVGGLASTAIGAWQLRRNETNRGSD